MSLPDFQGKDPDIRALTVRTGAILRTLRDSLQQLGLDKTIAEVAGSIPDARDRLGYVVKLTREAADGVLNSVEIAQPVQTQLAEDAEKLTLRWNAWAVSAQEDNSTRELAAATQTWLANIPDVTNDTRQQLHVIMMAQGFQDLTGQIVQRMVSVLNDVEQQLIQVLRDSSPGHSSTGNSSSATSPTVTDKASSQNDVDDLLASLGL